MAKQIQLEIVSISTVEDQIILFFPFFIRNDFCRLFSSEIIFITLFHQKWFLSPFFIKNDFCHLFSSKMIFVTFFHQKWFLLPFFFRNDFCYLFSSEMIFVIFFSSEMIFVTFFFIRNDFCYLFSSEMIFVTFFSSGLISIKLLGSVSCQPSKPSPHTHTQKEWLDVKMDRNFLNTQRNKIQIKRIVQKKRQITNHMPFPSFLSFFLSFFLLWIMQQRMTCYKCEVHL